MSLVCLKPFTGLNFFMIWTLHTSLALPVSLRPTACFSNPDLMVPHSIRQPRHHKPCYCTVSYLWSVPRLCALPAVVAHPLQQATSPSKLSGHPLARLYTIPHFPPIPCNSFIALSTMYYGLSLCLYLSPTSLNVSETGNCFLLISVS